MNHTHLSAKSKNAGNPVRAGLKRNKPSPLTLEPRLMFDAAAVSEGTTVVKDLADAHGSFLVSYAVSTATSSANVDRDLFTTEGGKLIFRNAPDYEAPKDAGRDNVYNVQVVRTNGWGQKSTIDYVITVANRTGDPVFTISPSANIDEGRPADSVIFKATSNTTNVTWSLGGADASEFSIANNGNVTLKQSADYETKSSYSIDVIATKSGIPSTQSVTITVNDVNEVPTITNGTPKTVQINENVAAGTEIYKAVATDPDSGDTARIKWSLTGQDSARFSIDNTGRVTINSSPNYEDSTNTDHSYSFNIVATDGRNPALSDTQAITVNLQDVEEPTIIDGPKVGDQITITVGENTKVVHSDANNKLTATDSDGPAEFAVHPVSDFWHWVAGDAAPITGSLGGKLQMKSDGNWTYTLPPGKGGDSMASGEIISETFDVQAFESGDVGPFDLIVHGPVVTQRIVINIAGENDLPTVQVIDVQGDILEGSRLSDSGSISFQDIDHTDRPTATEALKSMVATRADGTEFSLNSTQRSAIENAFSIAIASGSSNNGTINWNYNVAEAALDFLAKDQKVRAVFTVTVDDGHGGKATQDVTINITGTNDLAKVSSADRAVTERDTASALNTSGKLTIADPDSGEAKAVIQTGTQGRYGTFAVDADGNWTYRGNGAHNELAKGQIVYDTFTVKSVDGTGSGEVRIQITGTNDAPVITNATQWIYDRNLNPFGLTTVSVGHATETARNGRAVVFDGAASDPDRGDNLTWSMSGDTSLFSIDRNTGAITATHTADLENGRYYLTLFVRDSSGAMDSRNVIIEVKNINDPATFTGKQTATIGENDNGKLVFGDIDVKDVDGLDLMRSDIQQGRYGVFAINALGNWVYMMTEAHDEFRAGSDHTDTFTVKSSDGTETEVTIHITGSNDAPKIDLSDVDKPLRGTEDMPIPIEGISVSDVDSKWLMTTVSVAHGKLTIGEYSEPDLPSDNESPFEPKGELSRIAYDDGFGGLIVMGNGSSRIMLFGTAEQINEALSQLTYQARADYNGRDTLTVTTSDQSGPVKPPKGEGPYYSTAKVIEGDGPDYDGPDKHSVSKSIRIIVAPVADIADDATSTRQSTAVTIDVNANDSFENERHHITRIDGQRFGEDRSVVVENGVVTLNEDGTLSFKPNAGFYGDTSFTYTVRSGGVTETATVTVTVIRDAVARSATGGESGVGGITGAYVPGGGGVLGVSGFRGDLTGTRVPGQSDAPSGDAGAGFNPNALLNNAPTAAGLEGDLSEFLPFELAMIDLSGKDDFAVFIPAGEKASFALPADMLQGPQSADFAVFQANGEPLPDWLVFDPITGKFLGKAPEGMHGTIRIQLTGRDAKGVERVIRISVNVDVQERGVLAERMTTDRDVRLALAGSTGAMRADGRPGLSDQLQSARRGLSSERLARVVSNATMAKL